MNRVFFGSFCLLSAGAGTVWLVPGCGSGGAVDLSNIRGLDGGDGAAISARGVGERCDDGGVCRTGLACNAGICQPGRSSDAGTACVISAECKDGLYCGPERTCAPAGSGGDGAACASDGDCKSTFRCNLVGLSAVCQPEGDKDVGGACSTSANCFGGLFCADKVCAPPPPGAPPLGIPSFKGVDCPEETGPVTAYFRVPRGTDDGDYFRLPFPNDIHTKSGRPNLAGFPTPGADLLPYDLVDRWARYIEQVSTGFSVYPTVTFRFSGEIDFESLKTNGATKWVDLSPGEGGKLGHQWTGTTARNAYVCPNNVSFRAPTGTPLKPGHTYAVLVTNGAKTKDGGAIGVPPDLTALVAASSPGGALAAAYTAYQPLRDWAAAKSFNLASLVDAAVFTVGKHDDIAKKLAPAVAAATLPDATNWVKCGSAPSPCAQADGDRACPASADPSFDELHALVKLPSFQKGNVPFLEPADGGDMELDGTGQPKLQGTTQVCLALTVPKGTMPGGGWPLVIYAHGTGGSFRSAITEGVAGRLANVDGATKIAVLGIDQVGHGTRRGSSTAPPEQIFFNFTNPAAARGNVLQGAADQMALARFAKSLSLTSGSSPTGAAISFGTIGFWGHSQGATEGAVAMPYVANIAGALLSGEGGSLVDSLLAKKSPVNLAALAPVILSESPANINAYHPVLALLQNGIDPADPLDHADPIATAMHVFMPYGQKDTYAPPITQLTYALAAHLGVAAPPTSVSAPDDLKSASNAVPYGGNASGKTAVVRQYAPTDYDGHFVVFHDVDAKKNADRFLADVVTGVVPQVGR